jgi:CxxC-x17-CxxC domain-containing protein
MYEDKTLVCKECGNEFTFTAGEQQFYAEKGFENEPKKCKACRDAKKNANKADKEYHDIICHDCGGPGRVPFNPTEGKPVYCSACLAKRKEAGNQ